MNYFDSPQFIKYLRYLLYWTHPDYRKFIVYPNTLVFLELLQSKTFRDELKKRHCIEYIHEQVLLKWNYPHVLKNRLIEKTQNAPPASNFQATEFGGSWNDMQDNFNLSFNFVLNEFSILLKEWHELIQKLRHSTNFQNYKINKFGRVNIIIEFYAHVCQN